MLATEQPDKGGNLPLASFSKKWSTFATVLLKATTVKPNNQVRVQVIAEELVVINTMVCNIEDQVLRIDMVISLTPISVSRTRSETYLTHNSKTNKAEI